MKLIDIYQASVAAKAIKADPQQLQVLKQLQEVSDALVSRYHHQQSWWYRIVHFYKLKNSSQRGLYIYGNVGVGKTYLMDLFFNSLPFKRKLRMHFHVFMRQVHHNLQRVQGHANPLQVVARHFSTRAMVLCFDEFFVNDITDAMLLGRLFEALFARGVTLVTTSNLAPDDLYKDGLQRKLFLPTIALLKQQCDIIAMEQTTDYRLRALQQAGVYFCPLNEDSYHHMQHCFNLSAHGGGELGMPIIIESRPIATVMVAKHVVWFEFNMICSVPRSQMDYIAIAKQFKTVLISNIPQIHAQDVASITYFINLVDVFYDHKVHLILSAATLPENIYPTGEKYQEFQRTLSRLIEMQSLEYMQGKGTGAPSSPEQTKP